MSEEKATYNSAVARLRQIIEEIERGELDVDVLSAKVRGPGGSSNYAKTSSSRPTRR